ncbi:MFS transporter [Brachybacterium sp. DNPG3]
MDNRSTTPTAGARETAAAADALPADDSPAGSSRAGAPLTAIPHASPLGAAGAAPAELPADIAPDTGLPLAKGQVLRFAAGFLLFGAVWMVGLQMVAQVLLPQRLQDIGVASPEAMLGTANAATAIVSLVSNLVFGNLSDRTRSRFGRRAPWVLGGAVLGGGSLAAIGLVASPAPMILLYCLSMVGLNMMLAPAIAILADRVPMAVRGTMSAFYGAGLAVGSPLGALIGAAFITTTVPGFFLGGALMLLGGVIAVVLWPRERSAADLPITSTDLRDVLMSFRPPRHAPDFYKAFVGRFFMLVSIQMVLAYQLYIVQGHLGQSVAESARTIATMSVILLVAGLVGSLISGPISDRLGRRKLPVVVASVLFGIGVAMPWILPTTAGILLFAAIAGFGQGVYNSVDQALNVDVLPSEEEAGKDLGILNLSTTAGQTVGPLITSAIVVATGGYSAVFAVSILAAVLGAFTITRIKGVH